MFILGIVGNKKAGKDEVCKIVQKFFEPRKVLRISFADALKEEVGLAVGQPASFIETHKDNFRLILQGWGTDFRRKLSGKDYWIEKWARKVQRVPANTLGVVATDVRFLNEAACVHALNGILWRVVRPIPGSFVDMHESETELSQIKTDLTFVNDEDLPTLTNKVNQLLRQWRV